MKNIELRDFPLGLIRSVGYGAFSFDFIYQPAFDLPAVELEFLYKKLYLGVELALRH